MDNKTIAIKATATGFLYTDGKTEELLRLTYVELNEIITKAKKYDEVTEALVKENAKITEISTKTREMNTKLGLQIRDLQAALRAAARLIALADEDCAGITEEYEAARLTWLHHKPLIDSLRPKDKEPSQ